MKPLPQPLATDGPMTRDGLARAGYRWPAVLMVVGFVAQATGLALQQLVEGEGPAPVVGSLLTSVGMAVGVAGLASLLFAVATNRSFEWFMAWRYLKRAKGNPKTLMVGLSLLGLAATIYAVAHQLAPDPIGGIAIDPPPYIRVVKLAALGLANLGWLVSVFGALQLSFSVFTCISMFGVHLGTGALVVVLSVMGGFEHDLQQKILGTRAHAVVTRPDAMFVGYRGALQRIAATPGVRAVSPYLESEVMVTSQTNHEGILLRGIDPALIQQVTDLPRYMKAEGGAGSLENLNQPEQLAKIPAVPYGSWDSDLEPSATQPTPASRPAGVDLGQPPAGAEGADDQPVVPGEATSRPSSGRLTDREVKVGDLSPTRPVYPGLIVGAELARNLRLYVGDDVNLVAPLGGMSPAGPIPKARPFRIAGIFYSGMYEFDTKFAYATIADTQRFLGLDDEISGVEVKVDEVDEAVGITRTIGHRLGRGYLVRDWQQLNQKLFSALKLEKLVMFVVLIFIVLVASFSIVTNLVMVVLEKSKEIAALKALGASSLSIFRVFFHAGLYIGIIGMLVGLLQGVGICNYLAHVGLPLDPEVYYISELPVQIDMLEVAAVALAAIALSASATMYPALRAAWLRPVEGLRHE
jgi:lipoprotein-releasing system permease protein